MWGASKCTSAIHVMHFNDTLPSKNVIRECLFRHPACCMLAFYSASPPGANRVATWPISTHVCYNSNASLPSYSSERQIHILIDSTVLFTKSDNRDPARGTS